MACMSAAAGDPSHDGDLVDLWMEQAVLKLRVMCAAQDPIFLVTMHMILVWLQVHDTESRTQSLIGELSDAAAFQLGKTSPIAITLNHMTAAAGKKLPSSGLALGQLCGVVDDFSMQLGPDHPHTLVTLYYMCFHMMRVDQELRRGRGEVEETVRRNLENTWNVKLPYCMCASNTEPRTKSTKQISRRP